MSRSCQSATFSSPTVAYPRTTRASPQILSATIGFRLCGIADEPFWPGPNGSSTSRTSVRARLRISSANRSSDEARSASAESSSACRSRCRICVELGAGSRPSASHATRSTSGGADAYVPTAPESFPTRMPSSAWTIRARSRVELKGPAAELEPERRRLGVHSVRASDRRRVAVLLRARDDGCERIVETGQHEPPGVLHGERERGVEHVRRRRARSGTSAPARRAAPKRRRRRQRRRDGSCARARPRARAPGHGRWRESPRSPHGGTPPTSLHASSAASSTASHRSSFASSDHTCDIAGRE